MTARPVIVAPSILAASFDRYGEEIQSVVKAGGDWLHIDIMDGSFVPPITFGDNMVAAAKKHCTIPLDVHLMIEKPEHHISSFKKAGATGITVHQETSPHLHRILEMIRSEGMKAGVAINPGTPVETVFDVLECCDLVLIMTVNPGWGGQKFIPASLPKISRLRDEISRRGANVLIEVDGGINVETGKQCVKAGADVLVAGSYIFGNENRAAAISSLRS